MPATASSRSAATVMAEGRHFNWGAAIAGAVAATAVTFFLLTLGSGMWAVAIVAGLLLMGLSSVVAGSTFYAATAASRSSDAANSGYWSDILFRPAANTPAVAADKAEAGRILDVNIAKGGSVDDADSARLAGLVSQDAGIAMPEAQA